jgi:hypothetical protein
MLRRTVVCSLLASIVSACSGDHHDEDGNPALADVVIVGDASDEALTVMLVLTAKDVPSEHVSFVAPEAGATLSKATPATIEFQRASAHNQRRLSEPTPFRSLDAHQRFLADLKGLLRPLGVAHAHGAPFNGTGYFLVFTDAAKHTALRVFTDQTSYTPDASAWSALAAGTQPITLTVTSAIFEENAVLADGGPFTAGSVQFSVE